MSVEISENLPGISEATAELDRLIAAEATNDTAAEQPAKGQDSATQGTRAAQSTEKNTPTEKQPSTETTAPAEAAKAKAPVEKKEDEQADPDAGKTRYQKARERQERNWQALNAEKEALKAEKAELERQRQEYKKQQEATEKDFSPEAYENAADEWEKQGKFDLAEAARERAKAIRKDPATAQRKAAEQADSEQVKTQKKEWTVKAASEFPELAKKNSPLQVRVAQIFQQEPDLERHPKGIYLAARIAHLEAASAGVAAANTELTQLRAKVKELESLTSPGGAGDATGLQTEKSFEQKSEKEQYGELLSQAREIGNLR